MHILLLENDKNLGSAICNYFKKKSLRITGYTDVDTLLNEANLNDFNIAVFDISYDDVNGLDLLDYIHSLGINLPVIFITAIDSMELLSKAFARGCEDYVKKPFSVKELELRIAKALRARLKTNEIELGNDVTYIFDDRMVEYKNINLRLTPTQRKILYLLVKNRDRIVTYSQFQSFLWEGKEVSLNGLASHIRDIRRLAPGIRIKTLKGTGYALETA
jgi:DNA-binding response OmpR family regulator